MAKAGKFSKSVAEEFLSKKEEPAKESAEVSAVPEGYVLVPEGSRILPPAKTARIQLLVIPETHQLLKDLAKKEKTSVNQLAAEAFEMLFKSRGIK